MGKIVAQAVAARLGRSLLELGGNNAIIITPEADLKWSFPRRSLALLEPVATLHQHAPPDHSQQHLRQGARSAITQAYGQVRIGDPLDENNHVGPLIDTDAVAQYERALEAVVEQGGSVLVPGGRLGRVLGTKADAT